MIRCQGWALRPRWVPAVLFGGAFLVAAGLLTVTGRSSDWRLGLVLLAPVALALLLALSGRVPWLIVLVVAGLAVYGEYTPNDTEAFINYSQEQFRSVWSIHIVRGISLVDLGIGAALAVFVVQVVRARGRIAFSALDRYLVWLLPLLGYALVLGVVSRSPIQRWEYLLYSARFFCYLIVFYLLVSRLVTTRRQFLSVFWGLLLVVVARFAITSLTSLFFNPTQFSTLSGYEAVFFNETSHLVVFPIVAAAVLALTRRLPRGTYLLCGLLSLVMLVAATLSGRRGTLVFIVVGLVAVLPFLLGRRLFHWRPLVGALVGLALALGTIQVVAPDLNQGMWNVVLAVFGQGEKGEESGVDSRIGEVKNITANLSRYEGWVWGLGLGRAWQTIENQPLFDQPTAWSEDNGRGTGWLFGIHVYFLDLLLFFGAAGSALFLAVGLAIWWTSGQRGRASPDRDVGGVILASLAALSGLVLVATVVLPVMVLFACLLGLVSAGLDLLNRPTPATSAPEGVPALAEAKAGE